MEGQERNNLQKTFNEKLYHLYYKAPVKTGAVTKLITYEKIFLIRIAFASGYFQSQLS